MGDFITYEKIPERAVLIAVASKKQGRERTEEYLDELSFLLETAGGVPVARFVQAMDHPSSVTYLGSGKLEEIHQYIKAENIEIAVIDDELSTRQGASGIGAIPIPSAPPDSHVDPLGTPTRRYRNARPR